MNTLDTRQDLAYKENRAECTNPQRGLAMKAKVSTERIDMIEPVPTENTIQAYANRCNKFQADFAKWLSSHRDDFSRWLNDQPMPSTKKKIDGRLTRPCDTIYDVSRFIFFKLYRIHDETCEFIHEDRFEEFDGEFWIHYQINEIAQQLHLPRKRVSWVVKLLKKHNVLRVRYPRVQNTEGNTYTKTMLWLNLDRLEYLSKDLDNLKQEIEPKKIRRNREPRPERIAARTSSKAETWSMTPGLEILAKTSSYESFTDISRCPMHPGNWLMHGTSIYSKSSFSFSQPAANDTAYTLVHSFLDNVKSLLATSEKKASQDAGASGDEVFHISREDSTSPSAGIDRIPEKPLVSADEGLCNVSVKASSHKKKTHETSNTAPEPRFKVYPVVIAPDGLAYAPGCDPESLKAKADTEPLPFNREERTRYLTPDTQNLVASILEKFPETPITPKLIKNLGRCQSMYGAEKMTTVTLDLVLGEVEQGYLCSEPWLEYNSMEELLSPGMWAKMMKQINSEAEELKVAKLQAAASGLLFERQKILRIVEDPTQVPHSIETSFFNPIAMDYHREGYWHERLIHYIMSGFKGAIYQDIFGPCNDLEELKQKAKACIKNNCDIYFTTSHLFDWQAWCEFTQEEIKKMEQRYRRFKAKLSYYLSEEDYAKFCAAHTCLGRA